MYQLKVVNVILLQSQPLADEYEFLQSVTSLMSINVLFLFHISLCRERHIIRGRPRQIHIFFGVIMVLAEAVSNKTVCRIAWAIQNMLEIACLVKKLQQFNNGFFSGIEKQRKKTSNIRHVAMFIQRQ